MQKRVVCENLRSAYNVGNIIRTADGLGRGVILVWYTAPKEHKKVTKTALGAQETVSLLQFETLDQFYNWASDNKVAFLSAEKTADSIWLRDQQFLDYIHHHRSASSLVLVMGNEVTGVETSTLEQSDYIVHIPMLGSKESFNVGQAAAIIMWQIDILTA